MQRALILLALVVVAVLGSARVAQACTCVQSGPACQAFWGTPLVFDALASSVDEERGVATLDVRNVWKGTVPDRVVVPSGDGASCVYVFEAGRRYLVFAYHDPSNGRVRVSLCSATRGWDGTGNDAEFLASLSRPAAGGRHLRHRPALHTGGRRRSGKGPKTGRHLGPSADARRCPHGDVEWGRVSFRWSDPRRV